MTVSRGCIGYYRSYDLTMKRDWEDLIGDKDRDEGNVFRPGGLEEIAQGRGRCPQCAVLVRSSNFFLFATLQHPIFKLLNSTWHLNWWIFKLIVINTRLPSSIN